MLMHPDGTSPSGLAPCALFLRDEAYLRRPSHLTERVGAAWRSLAADSGIGAVRETTVRLCACRSSLYALCARRWAGVVSVSVSAVEYTSGGRECGEYYYEYAV